MGWAAEYIKKLQKGETVKFRPKGNSMKGRISSGQLCTVVPSTTFIAGDIVLCRVHGNEYLHIITSIKYDMVIRDSKTCFENPTYQISNNLGRVNGWIPKSAIFGKLTKIES